MDIPAAKNTVAAGAAALRHAAIQDRYQHPHRSPDVAFALASMLDLLGLRWLDLDAELQAAVLQQCQLMAQDDGQSRAFA